MVSTRGYERTHTALTTDREGREWAAAGPLGCELDAGCFCSASLCLFSASQTTEVIDEWNEFGELKVNLGAQ
jgi:hypothetical protein